ncbi:MAG: GNAT family N-acetyltransferase [Candidatus Methanoperedens sp.]|nr:GNAT family N-acetyltransferase [Candidatus Methanoperedens sp.]
MKYEIFSFGSNDEKEWDHFVDNHKKATFFHTIKWKKILEQTFNYKPDYLLVRNSERRIVGISPAFSVKTMFGRIVVSQPFFEYGGPIIENSFEGAYSDIIKYYINKINNNKIKYVEMKSLPNESDEHYTKNGFVKQFKSFGYYIDVKDKDFEKDIWLGLYNNKVRNSIRKGIKSGLKIVQEENIDVYYDLYLKTMAKLGSPPYPKTLFENIKKYAKSSVRFTFAYLEEVPIAGLWTLLYNNRVSIVGNVSCSDYQNFNANDHLYNEQIEYSTKNKFEIVDLGRTRPNSSYELYKKKWGALKIDMYSYVYPPSESKEIDPYKYYLIFSKITKKIPWIFTKTGIGSYLVKKFP